MNGDVYLGEVRDLKKNGGGTLTIKDGAVYHATFQDDHLMGQAKIVYSNSNVLYANFVKGKVDGKATLHYSSSNILYCEYENDRIISGRMDFATGERFVSEKWKNGYFIGVLTKETKEEPIKGYLCGETFLAFNQDFYCEEDEIREIFENKGLFFGYEEFA